MDCEVSRGLHFTVVGLCVTYHLLLQEASLMRAERCTDIQVWQLVIKECLNSLSIKENITIGFPARTYLHVNNKNSAVCEF